MCQGSKKITASGFLLLLAIPIFFSVGALIKQRFIQHTREERLEKESLQTIKIQRHNICWVKKDKEILIEGKLFDVKSFKPAGNYFLVTGFFDHQEAKLVQQIKDLAQQKNESGSPFSKLSLKFLFSPVYTGHAEILCERNWFIISRHYCTFSERIPVAPGHLIIHPPRS